MVDFVLPSGARVHLIGDPHIGVDFDRHAPAHRRGERAARQFACLCQELDADADIVVIVGDLFDDPMVPRKTVVSVADAIISAAERNEDVLYLVMAGNHDLPRNFSTVGAWPMFRRMVEDRLENAIVVTEPTIVNRLALFPWQWGVTAKEQVSKVSGEADAAVGHWDLAVFDGKDEHLAPVADLRKAFGPSVALYSGHYHVPGPYSVDGVEVICTGSMQPVTHGEDPKQEFYVTVTRAEALLRDDLYDKHVRVRLAPGEVMPDIDCLALTHIREKAAEVAEQAPVSIEDFDFTRIVSERISKRDPVVQQFISERMSLNVTKASEQH